ncbi:MAG: ketopantoate reductase C-terminal domain-containing protein, partial [Pseudomonadota bacterium]
ALVVSLQNGLANAEALDRALGHGRVVPGMVAFNVVREGPGRYAQATEGAVMVGAEAADFARRLDGPLVAAEAREDIEAIQRSKLLMNLNNALCLLSGLSLRDELRSRSWRRVLAACVAEGIAVAKAEGATLARLGKVHPKIVPFVLRLPDPLFVRAAAAMLKVDPAARTSMVDDYEAGRPSEIAYLNGHVAARGRALGLKTPVNARVTAAVDAAFADPARPPLAHDPARLLA